MQQPRPRGRGRGNSRGRGHHPQQTAMPFNRLERPRQNFYPNNFKYSGPPRGVRAPFPDPSFIPPTPGNGIMFPPPPHAYMNNTMPRNNLPARPRGMPRLGPSGPALSMPSGLVAPRSPANLMTPHVVHNAQPQNFYRPPPVPQQMNFPAHVNKRPRYNEEPSNGNGFSRKEEVNLSPETLEKLDVLIKHLQAQKETGDPSDIAGSLDQDNSLTDEDETPIFDIIFPDSVEIPRVNLDFPENHCKTGWNASEVLKDFLLIGAGHDKDHRCLVENPSCSSRNDRFVEQRRDYIFQKNVRFFLNMAGHPEQRELKNISYPADDFLSKSVELNDSDSWAGTQMLEAVEEGAAFINQAYLVHQAFTKLIPDDVPPKILVHCVGGVNRSAFVVVWWLVKYQNLFLKDAWNLVIFRRDAGVNWYNETLGGEVPENLEELGKEIEKRPESYYKFGSRGSSKHQHAYDIGAADNQPMTLALLNNSGNAIVSAKENNKFSKYFWYKNADRILNPFYEIHYPEEEND